VIVFAIGGRIVRGDVPALCARLRVLLESSPGDEVICDVGELVQVDLAAVETLARLQLVARRHRRRFRVRNAGEELRELLALVGLSEVVPLADALSRQPRGQPEEREQPRRVEEEGDPGDAIPS
jgi:ABC-type transporter Mla MlaB component